MNTQQNPTAALPNLQLENAPAKSTSETVKVLIGVACVSLLPLLYVVGRLVTAGHL